MERHHFSLGTATVCDFAFRTVLTKRQFARGTVRRIMKRECCIVLLSLSVVMELSRPGACQTNAELQTYFKNKIGLNGGQVAQIREGKPVTREIKSRTPADIIVFGAVYISTTPEGYIRLSNDFERLRMLPVYQRISKFSNPVVLSDLDGFGFGAEDVKELRSCKPGECKIQLPAQS